MILKNLPLIVCLAGLILFLATKGKVSDVGKWAFGIGLFVTLWKGIG